MKFASFKSLTAAVLAVGTLATISVPEASAAPTQNITANVSTVTATGWKLNMSWTAVSGATRYDVYYATKPDVQMSTATALGSSTTTSLSKVLDTSIGYRYFRVYAYNSSNTLLGFSNISGAAKYPSGLLVKMKQDSYLTSTYPSQSGAPDSSYRTPTWFITVDSTVRASYAATNFQIGEFIKNTALTSAVVDPKMIQHVQNARNRRGAAMSINSGYRSPDQNAGTPGSATYSRHMYGDAVDIPAASQSEWNYWDNLFAPEAPSYRETFAEGGYHHWHGDWRYENKGYQNYL